MSQLLALSFDVPASPSIWLRREPEPDLTKVGMGWGFAWYPAGSSAAAVIRDPRPVGDHALTRVISDWERFRSNTFLCHIRGAAKRPTEQDTHPFTRAFAGRTFSLIHTGQLNSRSVRELPLNKDPFYEPVGTTDSERALCWLLSRTHDVGARSLADIGFDKLHGWLRELNQLGGLTVILADGQSVVSYSDASGFRPLSFARRTPPHEKTLFRNAAIDVDIGDPLDVNRTLVLIATTPLSEGWTEIPPGEMVVVRGGAFEYESVALVNQSLGPTPVTTQPTPQWQPIPTPSPSDRSAEPMPPPSSAHQNAANGTATARSADVAKRRYRILHRTQFDYTKPVELSAHTLRLHPFNGQEQRVIEHSVEVSSTCALVPFEDVFGNQSMRGRIDEPYDRLEITARSIVEVTLPSIPVPVDNTKLPLVWMPWQRQMMTPYLLPPELPETQLQELSAFGLSFAERQNYDVVDTLLDLNQSIRRDFCYVQGVTSNETTPFEVYVSRRGVCQDFANLFICIARLLGVPARYRVGYIHTGADYENQVQSEASHAWAEAYIPWAGWRGFDPTNGSLAGLDHIQVATGRNYRDATPTSGTLFKGGGAEKLQVTVTVEVIDDAETN